MDTVVAAGLAQRYGTRWVFENLDITIGPGVTGLLGPNGAGKTTLLRTICTLHRPASGSLQVLGLDVSRHAGRRELRRSLGYLPQSFGYYPQFTVREFVRYAAWLKQVPGSEAAACADEAIEAAGLADRAGSKLRTLSGGLLRRAGIAQAIVHRPRLLVLDEPTGGLDPRQRVELRALVRRLAAHSAVIISTHLVEDAKATCGVVKILAPGKLAFSGSPDELEAAAADGAPGDNALERGYSTVLGRAAGIA